ncbi:MAG: L-ribulose-5-phosphate 4-epimerase [Atribacterota bacterium]|jgi:L-ribulose-5-phosphate 4-epimerase|nr:L-ribulose-5-phosphate 4-epimerase [Atribacterota bacterium]MDD5637068.1 L-ribulose-5-phosphate 4-epimerase [Atribacterota bacterium]
MLESLKKAVYEAHINLWDNKLVMWTSGNVSARDSETNFVVIKPSGVSYKDLSPSNLVVVDLNGNTIEGSLKPSVDMATHLYVYKHMPEVNSVIHTHSTYASAFAAVGMEIPVCLTAMADFFGDKIPLGELVLIGEEEIGKEIVNKIGNSKAIIMKNHGPFTIGKDIKESLQAAIFLEEAAKVIIIAKILGEPQIIPGDIVKILHKNYTEKYGQKRR